MSVDVGGSAAYGGFAFHFADYGDKVGGELSYIAVIIHSMIGL